jgi:hypothetical protein
VHVSRRLTEVITSGRVAASINAELDRQLVAIDVVDDVAGLFHLEFGVDHAVRAEATIAQRDSTGEWHQRVVGGSSYVMPEALSRRQDWAGDQVLGLGLTGTTLFLPDDTEREVIAVVGIASTATDTIRAATDRGVRVVRVGPSGAFIIVATRVVIEGHKEQRILTLTPEHADVALGPAESYP